MRVCMHFVATGNSLPTIGKARLQESFLPDQTADTIKMAMPDMIAPQLCRCYIVVAGREKLAKRTLTTHST